MPTNDLEKQVRDKYYSDLPQELLNEKTKSGAILILNRIGWGKAYLKQAGMVWQPERAMMQITDKGKEILKRGGLTLKELLVDKDFLDNGKINKEDKEEKDVNEEFSPQDMIDAGFTSIENKVKGDLLDRLRIFIHTILKELLGNFLVRWDMEILLLRKNLVMVV